MWTCILLSAVACLVINGSGSGSIMSLYRCSEDAFVMVVDYLFRVVHAAVTDLDGVSVEDFLSLRSLGKCLSTRARNLCPMLVLVFLLKGGLYQRMLLCCRFFRLHVLAGSYCSV